MSIKYNTAMSVCIGLLLISIVEQVSANPNSEGNGSTYTMVSDDILQERLQNLYSEIDLRVTADVKKYIYDYTVKYRHSAEDFLGRSEMYFPMFQEKLSAKGLPDEIKCLSIVESNLKPNAVSPHGATGLWQFMKSTGEMYDLNKNKYVDDRRDPEKSTEAAAAFLLDLYNKYNDWTLALAAYNCGPGNVNKAMRRSGKYDYWGIRSYLPKETQQYIPKLIAVIYVTQYYYAHNLTPKQIDANLQHTSSAKVWEGLSFKEIQKLSGLPMDVIKQLNPQYIRNYVPNINGEHVLTLPSNEMMDVAYAENTQLEIINQTIHYQNNTVAETPIVAVEEIPLPVKEVITISEIEKSTVVDLTIVESSPTQVPKLSSVLEIVAIEPVQNRQNNNLTFVDYKDHVIKRMRR